MQKTASQDHYIDWKICLNWVTDNSKFSDKKAGS